MTDKYVAYLTSEYPAPSHTFIRREVEALRTHGVHIDTFSIRRPKSGSRLSASDQAAMATTSYLLPLKPWQLLQTHLHALTTRPKNYFSTFGKALGHRAPGIRSLLWSTFYFLEAIVLAVRFEKSGINHVHNHFANAAANVGMLASHFLGLPWSMTLHGSADWAYPAGYLLPDKIKQADFVACVSQYGRAQACWVSPPSEWEKFFIARCGVDLSVFPQRRSSLSASSPLRLVTVGRLSPEKGQLGMLQAFAFMLKKGYEAELRIIGDGPLHAHLSNTILNLGIQERCVLLGQKTESEVLEELASADIFVLSSFMEGLPVVLMEALGLHVPVIAPCVAGIPELVRHGHSGLLFIAGDWDDLATQMEWAVRNPESLKEMAEQGYQQIIKEFDINQAIKPLAERFISNIAG